LKKLQSEDRAGLYITAIVHLAVIIILLATQLGFTIGKENTFVLDFTKQEEKEKAIEEEKLKEDALEQLERMIAAAGSIPIRNVTVNRSTQLKDDRNTDADQLYKDAERLARELREGQNQLPDDDNYVDPGKNKPEDRKQETKKETYSGPSVLSWELTGRKASKLPIPAYRCYGAGVVKVLIIVNNNGDVLNAKIDEGESSADGCLRSFAIRAARMSRFSASTTAPARQGGSITYAFIAQ
jgi:hypothetical protein